MIYLFTGDNASTLKQEIKRWKDRFIEKFGDFNLIHIKDPESTDMIQIQESLIGQSFLGGKRFVIIEGVPRKADESGLSTLEDFLSGILEKVPEEYIIVFSSLNPDKRGSFYKYLLSGKAELKEFTIGKDPDQILLYLSRKYPHIQRQDIGYILKLKGNSSEKTLQEIEKLLIYKDPFSLGDIKEHILPELEESIFELTDSIMNKNCSHFLNILQVLKNQMNFYLFYNSLLGNLRNLIYIDKLKSIGVPQTKIGAILNLGNRTFLVQKSWRIQSQNIQNLYQDLIQFDTRMKTGATISTSDEDFFGEIEIICIKNMNS